MKKVVVIGSGIGGLVSAFLLARQGEQVIVLEQDVRPGGCLRSFHRCGRRFDTGMHYVGGLAKGGALYPLFHDLGLTSLPWKEVMEQDVYIDGQHFIVPTGVTRWQKYMISMFPHEEEAIGKFLQTCQTIASCQAEETLPYWEQNAREWLNQTIDDLKLRNLLSGAGMMMEMEGDTLPLFAYAEIVYSFLHSCHRLDQGGEMLVEHLCHGVEQQGGRIVCNAEVVSIVEKDGSVCGVVLQDGTIYDADIVLSAIHPTQTMHLLGADTTMRRVYKQRMEGLVNTCGCYTCNLLLRPKHIPYQEGPVHIYREGSDPWRMIPGKVQYLMAHMYPEGDAMDLLTPLGWEQVCQWEHSPSGEREREYADWKQRMQDECIALAEQALPGLIASIRQVESSTPLTWQHFLHAPQGTAFGVRKDCHCVEQTLISPRTPLKGLYLTGQSLNLHGIMGTTMAAYRTVEYINQA